MKVSILTLGCKANQSESHFVEARLRSKGHKIVDLEEKPDCCIINTCSVTAKSDYQSRQLIRRAARAGSRIVVTGCYSELNRGSVAGMDGVTDVVDNDSKHRIDELLDGVTSPDTSRHAASSRSRFFLKVQDGCNNVCSYCIIPRARGRSRSVDIQSVIEEVKRLSRVYNEIVLTGIHLGTYGYDLVPKVQLSDMLSSILIETSIRRVRLSSLEIGEIDEKLLELMQEDRVCNHLHIPLQSGADRILCLMKRNYTTTDFLEGIGKVLGRVRNIAIGTDMIVGFPGEGEKEFNDTVNLLASVPFAYVHVFPFSSRPGTQAAQMGGAVGSATVKERCAVVRALGRRKKEAFMASQVGRTLDLLVEERGSGNTVLGTTGNYLKVKATTDTSAVRDIVPVSIAGVDGDVLVGLPIAGS